MFPPWCGILGFGDLQFREGDGIFGWGQGRGDPIMSSMERSGASTNQTKLDENSQSSSPPSGAALFPELSAIESEGRAPLPLLAGVDGATEPAIRLSLRRDV